MFWNGLSTARDLGRLHDIASILIRYGFGDAVRRLGLSSALEQAGKVLHWKDAEQYARMEPPQRVCRALQDLGPTFVKLGQVLSTRVDVLIQWTENPKLNVDLLTNDIDMFIDQYHGLTMSQINMSSVLIDLMALLREHKLHLPPDLALLVKAFISLDGMGRQLDPDFELSSTAQPFVRHALISRFSPDALLKRGWKGLTSTIKLISTLPQDINRLIISARKGAIQVKIDVPQLENFTQRLDRATSRLTVGIVTSALIIGSSIVMTVKGGPTLLGLPLFGLFGFVGAVIGGIWLLLSIWQSNKRK